MNNINNNDELSFSVCVINVRKNTLALNWIKKIRE